jgi:hypothetical protein
MPEMKAWPEGPIRAIRRGHRRDEGPQSEVRLRPHRVHHSLGGITPAHCDDALQLGLRVNGSVRCSWRSDR